MKKNNKDTRPNFEIYGKVTEITTDEKNYEVLISYDECSIDNDFIHNHDYEKNTCVITMQSPEKELKVGNIVYLEGTINEIIEEESVGIDFQSKEETEMPISIAADVDAIRIDTKEIGESYFRVTYNA